MTRMPPAIVFVNGDITYPATPPPYPPDLDVFIGSEPNNPTSYITSASELTTIQTQLFINDTITKKEFDARMRVDPNYAIIVHLQGLRVLVVLPTFHDMLHRDRADVVMFLHQGLADIETNWFGPCGQSIEMQRFTIYEVLRAAHEHNVINLPPGVGESCCNECQYPFYCDRCHTFSGIKIHDACGCGTMCGCDLIDNQGRKYSPIHLPNCDNIFHNPAFINRK
jgi:hypothetical protein